MLFRSMNMQGTIAEKRYGYSIITAFYSGWSAAGILGGLWNAAAGRLGLSLGVAFAIAGAAGLAAAVVSAPRLFGREADVAPVSEAAASAAGSGLAISRVNVFNYVGFLLGAALAGGIAGVVGGPAGWRAAFVAPLVLTVVIAALAGGFSVRGAPRPDPVPAA